MHQLIVFQHPPRLLNSPQITEYLDPVIKRNRGHTLPQPVHSKFMEGFLSGNFTAPTGK